MLFAVLLVRTAKVSAVFVEIVRGEVRCGSYSGRRRLLVVWPRRPRGRNRSFLAREIGMCRLSLGLLSALNKHRMWGGVRTPSSMVFPAVLGLKVLSGETRIAITLPDPIREKTLEWDLLQPAAISAFWTAFTAAFEHA